MGASCHVTTGIKIGTTDKLSFANHPNEINLFGKDQLINDQAEKGIII